MPALIPFHEGSRRALELTFNQALRLGHNYVGTEHILLALLECEDDAGGGVLTDVGVRREPIEQHITAALARIVAEQRA